MAQQNINLLLSSPKVEATPYLTLKTQVIIVSIFVVFLFSVYLLNQYILVRMEKNFKQFEVVKNQIFKGLEEVQGKLNALQMAEKTGSTIIDLAPEETNFTPYLEKLSVYTPYGIWLTSININQEKKTIELKGNALHEAFVPEFIRLINQKHVSGEMQIINLTFKKDKGKNFISFDLNNISNLKKE